MSQYCEEHNDWDACAQDRWDQRQRDAAPGDPATLCYPDDRYPYVVVRRTPTLIDLREVSMDALDTINDIDGDRRGGWPVKDRSSREQNLPAAPLGRAITARWSEKKKTWYAAGTTPIVIGYARFLRDYSL